MILEPAGKIIKGGAIGYIKEATGLGRKKRDTTGNRKGSQYFHVENKFG